MTYETALTVREAVDNVHRRRYVLPAIQREFVWEFDQIELLFDSLLQGYPVGSFLFWRVNGDQLENYQFYEFIREYHERDQFHNPPAKITTDEITVVLDGQQRLTALYIGLLGTYAYKLRYGRWNDDSAFPKRRLCLNLTKLAGETDENRRFQLDFMSESDLQEADADDHWFPVGTVMQFSFADVNKYLRDHSLTDNPVAGDALSQLFQVVMVTPLIPYYLEKDQDVDKVLNIFIRANTAGTRLEYSDLLLSIATANWQKQNAREEIIGLVDQINRTGDGYDFDKDFVLKSALVLTDSDIAFKVRNFSRQNVRAIEAKWNSISDALRLTVRLLDSLGFSEESLPTKNAIIPIAYYLLKVGADDRFLTSMGADSDRKLIRKWLATAILKRAFSGQSDTVLRWVREVVAEDHATFPTQSIAKRLAQSGRSMQFSKEEIPSLLDNRYGQPYTFSVLSLLYPTLDYRNKFQVDHIHPRSFFDRWELKKRGVPPELWDLYLSKADAIGNLQLLEGLPNRQKTNQEFSTWVEETFSSTKDRLAYFERNYIPSTSLNFPDFLGFVEGREHLLEAALDKLVL